MLNKIKFINIKNYKYKNINITQKNLKHKKKINKNYLQ